MKNKSMSINLPFSLLTNNNLLLDATIDSNSYSTNSYTNHTNQTNPSFSPKKVRKFLKKSPYLPFIVVFAIVIVIGVIVFRGLTKNGSAQNVLGANASSKVQLNPPLAQETLNREFQFPLRDSNGKEVSKIKYEIQNIELRDQIIIQGEKATAVAGRAFLILNLKITNDYQKSIKLNARDYLRLSVNNSDEKLAPDIHNDPVEVQAISTKYTRLGFPINLTDKNLTLQVGEISGSKDTIKLNLK